MQSLLAQRLAHASSSALRDYTAYLLSQFDVGTHMGVTARENASLMDSLVEPLSTRELEVLHLMALGKTNREIAQQLVVAPGTVKAHTASIYRKLNVANRTEAVAYARQLNLLP
jgi:LuxR family maltose regulon positive regulatory protein